MRTFKINKRDNELLRKEVLNNFTLSMSGNNICMTIDSDSVSDLVVGGRLHVEKVASGNSGQFLKVCSDDVEIKQIVRDEYGKTFIYFDYILIQPLIITSFKEIESPEGFKYKFFFSDNTNLVPGDLERYISEMGKDYSLYCRRGENIIAYGELALCYPNELISGKDIISTDGYCCNGEDILFNYETMERNSVLAKTQELKAGTMFSAMAGDEVFLSTNPYFFTKDTGEITLFNNVTIEKYVDFMSIGVVLEEDYDAKRMFEEYQVNNLFVKKIKNSIIPDFIDLEKVKFAPAHNENDTLQLATGLTFNLHFRERQSGETEYTFADTWYIPSGDTEGKWNTSGLGTSDLMGFLGFTDEDIFNQKNRVKKSFLRLSFYDTDSPLTQHLLYYSTIFFDSGELYGKFIKRKAWLEDNVEGYDEKEHPVVWYSAVTEGDTEEAEPITSQITVNDEYDVTKSSEGFNLYLFKEDAPFNEDGQTLFMKVEFNHAGYGRTIPLTNKPTSNGVENYLQNIYIKVKISLSEKGYTYSFPDEEGYNITWENDRIVLDLFEPVIKPEN